MDHNRAGINTTANHNTCATCHVAPDAPYVWGTHHEDGSMEYNNSANYNEANGTCTSACHDDTKVMGVSSIFTGTVGLAGSSTTCSSCHAYPPDPADGMTGAGGYTPNIEGKGVHLLHRDNLIVRTGVADLDPNTDVFGDAKTIAVCGACHDMTVGHLSGIHIQPSTDYRFNSSTTPTYNGTVGEGSATTPKTCSSIGCHFVETPLWQQPQ